MSDDFYVYVYKDPNTMVPVYVGKGRGERFLSHQRKAKKSNTPNGIRWNFIHYLRKLEIPPIIEFPFTDLNEEMAFQKEAELIEKYGRILDGGSLFNIWKDRGGKSTPKTEEMKRNLSRALKGRKITWGSSISESLRGGKLKEETKKRMSESRKGHKNHAFVFVNDEILLRDVNMKMPKWKIAQKHGVSLSTIKRKISDLLRNH